MGIRFNKFESHFCSILLFLMLCILSLQVIARFIFGTSFSWSEEIARYLFIWFIFFGMSYAIVEKAHISIDSLLNIFPENIRDTIRKTGMVIWLLFSLVIVYQGLSYTFSIFYSGQFALGSGLPMWIVYSAIPLSFLLSSFRIFQKLYYRDVTKDGMEGVEE